MTVDREVSNQATTQKDPNSCEAQQAASSNGLHQREFGSYLKYVLDGNVTAITKGPRRRRTRRADQWAPDDFPTDPLLSPTTSKLDAADGMLRLRAIDSKAKKKSKAQKKAVPKARAKKAKTNGTGGRKRNRSTGEQDGDAVPEAANKRRAENKAGAGPSDTADVSTPMEGVEGPATGFTMGSTLNGRGGHVGDGARGKGRGRGRGRGRGKK